LERLDFFFVEDTGVELGLIEGIPSWFPEVFELLLQAAVERVDPVFQFFPSEGIEDLRQRHGRMGKNVQFLVDGQRFLSFQ
jgi:hypothetical protein